MLDSRHSLRSLSLASIAVVVWMILMFHIRRRDAEEGFDLIKVIRRNPTKGYSSSNGRDGVSHPGSAQNPNMEGKHAPPLVDGFLNVPFFVYTDLGLPEDGTIDGVPFSMEPFHKDADSGFETKHYEDLYLAEASLTHPMRTLNPEDAKLFFVPASLNYVSLHFFWKTGTFCIKNETICNEELVRHVDDYLAESPWFQRNNGTDHVIVASSWFVQNHFHRWEHWFPGWWAPNIRACNMITFESMCAHCSHSRVHFPSYYVGTGCRQASTGSNKTADFAMIGEMEKLGKPVVERENICKWIKKDRSGMFEMPICGRGKQCPALANAKFGFHVRGNTFGANRLMDTILSETVPIFTQQEQYRILPAWIDWNKLSIFADVRNETSFVDTLTDALDKDNADTYEKLHQNVIENRDLFDFRNHSELIFDVYMYMFQVSLWPETWRNVTSKYSALILDERLLERLQE